MNDASLRSTHDDLLQKLSRRRSIFSFAHGAVSLFIACIMAGAAYRLGVDTEYAWAPSLVGPALVISGAALVYSLVRFAMGRVSQLAEDRDFDELRRLRAELKLDDPPALGTPR